MEISRKTRTSRRFSGQCSLCSIPRFKRSFLCGFLWFFEVSLAAFLSLFWLFGVVCHARFAPCSCCCSHVHGRSPMETMRWQADASSSRSAAPRRRLVGRVLFPAARASSQPSEHEDLLGSATSRNCLGTRLSRNLRSCTALPQITVKVMDEYIVPNCTALMELGRKFLLTLDNAPSHASRLALSVLQYSVARHSRVSTSVLSRSLSLRLFFLERAQSTARSVSCSCQSPSDPRVSQDVGRQP